MDQMEGGTGRDVKLRAGLTDEDVELMRLAVDDVTPLIRFALSRNEAGDIEVYSCQSGVTLVLPVRDVDLLIDGIRGFLNDETERETISLCPISGKCESDKT